MCERGELEPEQAYELFKEFEDQMVAECTELMEAEAEMPAKEDAATESGSKKVVLDDPPGEGPVLRWESRIVFAHGGDAWHPKNRKVKLSVTVKELGLSRHAFRRLREVVGKRYNSGKDELTITSERYSTSFVYTFTLKVFVFGLVHFSFKFVVLNVTKIAIKCCLYYQNCFSFQDLVVCVPKFRCCDYSPWIPNFVLTLFLLHIATLMPRIAESCGHQCSSWLFTLSASSWCFLTEICCMWEE